MPVFAQGLESGSSVQRHWRTVDTSSVKWLEGCRVEVDADECSASATDPIVDFLKMATKVMIQTGGAIPSIVDNALDRDGWEDELDALVRQELDENTMRTCLGVDLRGKLIRIVGSKSGLPKFVSPTAEGSARWSLEASQFQSACQVPDMDKAELYIFVNDFETVGMLIKLHSRQLLGRLRVFIHEMIHGMRFLRALLRCPGPLTWFRNIHNDWCLERSVFDKHIATPPRFGPAPQGAAASSKYPADAGRVWEHSITRGKAFFQKDLEVVVFVGGKFSARQLSVPEAWEVESEPRKLIDISRNMADAVAAQAGQALVLYTTTSGTVPAFEYQCSGSARWLVENLDEYYSRKDASSCTEHAAPSATQVCRSFGSPSRHLLMVGLCRCGTTERMVLRRSTLAERH
jgi:hypothetical protein